MVDGAGAFQMAVSPIQTSARILGVAAAPMPPPSHAMPFNYVSYSDEPRSTDMMATDCVPADFGGKGFCRPQDGARQTVVGVGPPEADSLTT